MRLVTADVEVLEQFWRSEGVSCDKMAQVRKSQVIISAQATSFTSKAILNDCSVARSALNCESKKQSIVR